MPRYSETKGTVLGCLGLILCAVASVGGLVGFVGFIYEGESTYAMYVLLIMVPLGLLALWLMDYGESISQKPAEKLLEEDDRAPILILRSFSIDSLSFRLYSQYGGGTTGETWNFEHYLSKNLNEIGPVYTIGRPDDKLPPIGTSRYYLKSETDENWKDILQNHITRAVKIVIVVDFSPGLSWEIEYCFENIEHSKILLVLPPNFVKGYDKNDEKYYVFKHYQNIRSKEYYEKWNILRQKYDYLPEIDDSTIAIIMSNTNPPEVFNAPSKHYAAYTQGLASLVDLINSNNISQDLDINDISTIVAKVLWTNTELRISPDDDAEIVTKLEHNQPLILLDEQDSWYQVYIDEKLSINPFKQRNITGWIKKASVIRLDIRDHIDNLTIEE